MKKNKIIQNKTQFFEVLFFVAYGIYLFINILGISFFEIYIKGFKKIASALCILIIIYKEMASKKISKKEIIYLILIGILLFPVLLHKNGSLFVMFVLLYGARKIKFEKIAKFTLIESSILLITIIISAKLGIILNYVSIEGGRIREYLGFRYALFPQMILFNMTALDLYLHRKKSLISRYIFWILANYWLFCNTDSRLSFYLAILLIIVMVILEKFPNLLKKRKTLCFFMSSSFIVCSILSLFLICNYDSSNTIMNKTNKILGNRLYLGKISLSQYPINLFGHDTQFIGNGLDMHGNNKNGTYFYVDCLYLNILEKYGIIFTILFFGLLTKSLFKAWENEDYHMLIIMTVLALHGMIDDLEIYLYYNTFWFVINKYPSYNIFKENKISSEEKLSSLEVRNEI